MARPRARRSNPTTRLGFCVGKPTHEHWLNVGCTFAAQDITTSHEPHATRDGCHGSSSNTTNVGGLRQAQPETAGVAQKHERPPYREWALLK
jgi:hypothetical protein